MTTYSFQGVAISFDWDSNANDNYPVEFLGDAELAITAPDNSTISYETLGDGMIQLNLNDGKNFSGATFTAGTYDDADLTKLDVEEELVVIDWTMNGQSYSTTVFHLEIYDNASDYDSTGFFFVVDGDPIPLTSIEAYESIDAYITGVDYPSGDLAPGATFGWDDLNPTSFTENDEFLNTRGKDRFDGGAGIDTVIYDDGKKGINVNLTKNYAVDSYGKKDKLISIENVQGTSDKDKFKGDNADNEFWGNGGKDKFDGGKGNDVLHAGSGKNILKGGAGADEFDFSDANGLNIVKDFKADQGDTVSFADYAGGIDSYEDMITNHVAETKKFLYISDEDTGLKIKFNKVALDDLTEDAFIF